MTSSLANKSSRLMLVAAMLLSVGEVLGQNGLYLVGARAGGGPTTIGTELSDDGRTLTGYSLDTSWGFTYTRDGGRQDLPLQYRTPLVTSGDGSVVGGVYFEFLPGPLLVAQMFRYTAAGGFQVLSNGLPSLAAMSASGNAMCGYNPLNGGVRESFVWTPSSGMRALRHPTLPIFSSEARDMTADGLTIVGDYNVGLQSFPMIWRAETGMQQLPFLAGTSNGSAYAVSPDGRHIVGDGLGSGSSKFFALWSNGNEPESLGELGPSENPTAVTNDGLIVGDWGGGSRGAWIWSAETGKMSLRDYAAMNGVEIDPTVRLTRCDSVSLDGRTFAGSVTLPDGSGRAYMLVIPSPSFGPLSLVALGIVALRRTRRAS